MDVRCIDTYKDVMPWAKHIIERGKYEEPEMEEMRNWCVEHFNGKYHIGYFIWFELLEDKIYYILKWK